jgi:O-antigen ligase
VPRRAIVAAAAVGVLAVVLAIVLRRQPPPSPIVIVAGGAAALVAAALVFVRYDAAVFVGLVLLAAVRFEPAPADAVLALAILVGAIDGRFQLRRVPSLVLALLAALVALNLISAVGAVSAGTAAGFLGITLYVAIFGVWLAGYVDRRSRARLVLSGYLVAALLSAALGVLATVAPIPGRSAFLFNHARAEGLFKDPNVFGPFLVLPLLILLEETVTPRLLGWHRALKLAGVVLLALGVLFSYSRGAWLNLGVALIVMLAVLLLRPRSTRTNIRLFALLVVVTAVGLGVVAATGSGSFLAERAHAQRYDLGRFSAQEAGIRLGEQHPFGVGPGQFDVLEPLAAHSLYVRAFAEQGPAGLFVLVALLLATLGLAVRNAAHGRDTYGIGSAALLGALCGLLLNSVVIDTLHWRHLWLIAALIWAGASRSAYPVRAPARAHVHRAPVPAGTVRDRRR